MPDFVTVTGFIEFEPRVNAVGDKEVRNISVYSAGSQKQFGISVWPEFAEVPLNEGDVVMVRGKLQERAGQRKDGTKTTFLNMNAVRLAVNGKVYDRADRDDGGGTF